MSRPYLLLNLPSLGKTFIMKLQPICRLLMCLATGSTLALLANNIEAQTAAPHAAQVRADGQHDFDFEIGSWKIHLNKLVHPLTGSTEWVEFDGTSNTRAIWDGRANVEEFETDGVGGHIEGMTLRLYDPVGKQWSLHWANSRDGNLAIPTIGSFKDGRGEFYDFERIGEKNIWVRYQWSEIKENSAHFEQAFSEDGGRTWEVNWITDQTRMQ